MNKITMKLLLLIGPTIIESILNSILTEEKLTSFKDNLITFFREKVDKTVTEVDDYLLEIVVDTIMEPGQAVEHTLELCKIMKGYITESQTEWDDIVFLPILNRIEELGTTPVKWKIGAAYKSCRATEAHLWHHKHGRHGDREITVGEILERYPLWQTSSYVLRTR